MRNSSSKQGRNTALGLVVGVLLGLSLSLLPRGSPERELLLTGCLALYPAFYLAVVLHEAGHAIIAVIVGLKLRALAVWPFLLQRFRNHWRVSYLTRLTLPAFVVAYPVRAQNVRRNML